MKRVRWISLTFVLIVTGGCSSADKLMPTPNLYLRKDFNPFADVPPALQNNSVDVLYLTDRERENSSTENAQYGYARSRSVAFGLAHVEFGKDVSWDQLVQASRSSKRSVDLPMRLTKTTELGRFAPTPKTLVELPDADESTESVAIDENVQNAQRALSAELAKTPVKEVYVFVHGYDSPFYDGVETIAQLWHFLGRRGVPVAYTWPAGHGGLLRGYTYDRESSEFTVFHLKEMLRHIAANPDVKKVHLLGHSRGTDIVLSALRELNLEISGGHRSTREVLKLGNVVLAAPDVDFDVFMQRAATARLGKVPEQAVVYVCQNDSALGLSNWLFGGRSRMGMLTSKVFTAEELVALRKSKTLQIIDARVSDPGESGHSYFQTNPAVSSDLMLLMRYHLPPGSDDGRPLRVVTNGFWVIDDEYPGDVPKRALLAGGEP